MHRPDPIGYRRRSSPEVALYRSGWPRRAGTQQARRTGLMLFAGISAADGRELALEADDRVPVSLGVGFRRTAISFTGEARSWAQPLAAP